MLSSRQLFRSHWVQRAIGGAAAHYLRLVWRTCRIITEPAGNYERMDSELPVIVAMWHGQHFLVPFIRQPHHKVKVLISRHRDGEINAVAAESLGIGTIRGSGSHGGDFHKKGGVTAFGAIVDALADGYNVAMTADVPKVSRVAGLGIVKIAQMSGRPILPVAVNTTHRIELSNWDRTTINLPFGRAARVASSPIYVPQDADAATLELARRAVEEALNAVTLRADELTRGAKRGGARG